MNGDCGEDRALRPQEVVQRHLVAVLARVGGGLQPQSNYRRPGCDAPQGYYVPTQGTGAILEGASIYRDRATLEGEFVKEVSYLN